MKVISAMMRLVKNIKIQNKKMSNQLYVAPALADDSRYLRPREAALADDRDHSVIPNPHESHHPDANAAFFKKVKTVSSAIILVSIFHSRLSTTRTPFVIWDHSFICHLTEAMFPP